MTQVQDSSSLSGTTLTLFCGRMNIVWLGWVTCRQCQWNMVSQVIKRKNPDQCSHTDRLWFWYHFTLPTWPLLNSVLWIMTLWICLVEKTTGSQPECFLNFSVYKVTLGWLGHAHLSPINKGRFIEWRYQNNFYWASRMEVGVYNHIWFCNTLTFSYKYTFWQHIFTKLKFISFWRVGRGLGRWERIVLNLLQ